MRVLATPASALLGLFAVVLGVTACAGVSVESRRATTARDVSRGCRFAVGVVEVSSLTFSGAHSSDRSRNEAERQRLEALLRESVVAVLDSAQVRVERGQDPPPGGDLVLVSTQATHFDRGEPTDPLARSVLRCKVRLLRGVEGRVVADLDVATKARGDGEELLASHLAIFREFLSGRLGELLD